LEGLGALCADAIVFSSLNWKRSGRKSGKVGQIGSEVYVDNAEAAKEANKALN
jgi:hypothetical protein